MKFQESPLPSAIVFILLAVIFSAISVCAFQFFFVELRSDIPKLTFICYLSAYIAMWTLYFASKNGPPILRVSTLRRILLVESKSWSNIDTKEDGEIEEISMEKAKTSITAIAMLVGVSFLGISQAKSGLIALNASGLPIDSAEYIWQQYSFYTLSFISTIAIVCFVLSVDALDCMFNEFKTDKLDNKFRRYFYKSTIHPRYIGFVCLLTSIIFLNASSSVTLGSITIAIIIAIGYRHWFPHSDLASESWTERSGVSSFWIRFIPLISVPIVVNFI